MCVPPDRATGHVTPVTLAAAAVAGIDEVYAIGGAQAIGALAYGTASVPAVDVICGPGNKYVALAKQRWPAPSAWPPPSRARARWWSSPTGRVPPDFAAIDVILQAEHGPDGLAWLITWDEDTVADAVVAVGGAPDRGGPPPGGDRRHPGRWGLRRAGGLAGGRHGGGEPRGARSTSSCSARSPSGCSHWCATPVRSSWGRGRRRRSATTWRVPATCCPPTAPPGSRPPSPWTTSSSTTT